MATITKQPVYIGYDVGEEVPAEPPESRPAGYDPNLWWDEDNNEWSITPIGTLEAGGGGRFKQQIIVIGIDNNGNGIVYFG